MKNEKKFNAKGPTTSHNYRSHVLYDRFYDQDIFISVAPLNIGHLGDGCKSKES